MKLIYEEPEVKIREYKMPVNGILTTSQTDPDTDLGDGDYYGDIFG